MTFLPDKAGCWAAGCEAAATASLFPPAKSRVEKTAKVKTAQKIFFMESSYKFLLI
jgi:hypothetical protein